MEPGTDQLFAYDSAPVPVRADLADAHRRAFARIAAPGTWWTGAERVALAQESRAALGCSLCARRKQALSPFAVDGDHDRPASAPATLPEGAVDAVHRLVTDPARLSQTWLDELIATGDLTVEQYVELVGVVTQTMSIDAVHTGLGIAFEALPEPVEGEPTRRRPSGAAMEQAWVPMVLPDNLDPEDRDLYGGGRTGNVIRAMSLVPDEVRALRDLHGAQYLTSDQMMQFGSKFRSIDRAQMELVAGRVSALNECFY